MKYIIDKGRMNYSRYLFFNTFIKEILEYISTYDGKLSSRDQKRMRSFLSNLVVEVKFQIERITSKQKGGYWPVTNSDKIILEYLSDLIYSTIPLLSKQKVNKQDLHVLTTCFLEYLKSAETENSPKVKIVFLAQETVGWPSFESVYEAFAADPVCETQIIYVPFEHINNNKSIDWFLEYKKKGLPIIHCDQYDLSTESPDMVFFMKPYDGIPMNFYIDAVNKVVERSIYIPCFVNWMAFKNIHYLINYHYRLPLQYKAWKIFDSPPYIKEYHKTLGYRNGSNVEVVGHPRFDFIHKKEEIEKEIPTNWRDVIKNKKVFLWNTHVCMGKGESNENDWSTFEEFGQQILHKFKNDQTSVLLWRPHPSFFIGLLNNKIFSKIELENFLKEISIFKNIIIDNTSDYRIAFSAADAMISDASSLLVEFLQMNKPILYTYKESTCSIVNERLLPAFYKGGNFDMIDRFIEMVKKGEDNEYESRTEVIQSIDISSDRNIGEVIKEKCVNDMIFEETDKAKQIIEVIKGNI